MSIWKLFFWCQQWTPPLILSLSETFTSVKLASPKWFKITYKHWSIGSINNLRSPIDTFEYQLFVQKKKNATNFLIKAPCLIVPQRRKHTFNTGICSSYLFIYLIWSHAPPSVNSETHCEKSLVYTKEPNDISNLKQAIGCWQYQYELLTIFFKVEASRFYSDLFFFFSWLNSILGVFPFFRSSFSHLLKLTRTERWFHSSTARSRFGVFAPCCFT